MKVFSTNGIYSRIQKPYIFQCFYATDRLKSFRINLVHAMWVVSGWPGLHYRRSHKLCQRARAAGAPPQRKAIRAPPARVILCSTSASFLRLLHRPTVLLWPCHQPKREVAGDHRRRTGCRSVDAAKWSGGHRGHACGEPCEHEDKVEEEAEAAPEAHLRPAGPAAHCAPPQHLHRRSVRPLLPKPQGSSFILLILFYLLLFLF